MFKNALAFANDVLKQADVMVIELNNKDFGEIYKCIEQYIIDNTDEQKPIFVSSPYKLVNKKNRNTYKYLLYTENALYHSNELTNKIFELNKNVILKTVIRNREFKININGITFIEIYSIATKEQNISAIFPNISYDGINFEHEKKNMLVVDPMLELISVYRKLYHPRFYDEWKEILEYENDLLFNFLDRQKALTSSINTLLKEGGKSKKKEYVKDDIISNIIMKVYEKYVVDNDQVVLLGKFGYDVINKQSFKPDKEFNRLQILTTDVSDNLLINITKIVSSIDSSYTILSYQQYTHVFNDHRLKRTIYKINDTKVFVEVYNSAEYDLIPYLKIPVKNSFVQVGNQFVLMRFVMVSSWVISLAKNTGKLRDEIFSSEQKKYINLLKDIRKLKKPLFEPNYVGKYVSDELSKKELMKNSGTSDYIPLLYTKNHKELRKITH